MEQTDFSLCGGGPDPFGSVESMIAWSLGLGALGALVTIGFRWASDEAEDARRPR